MLHALPPLSPRVAACVSAAARRYAVPALLLRSVLHIEGGAQGVASPNTNGTEDLGWAQINTVWLKKLSHYGITRQDLLTRPCSNIAVEAWILRRNFLRYRDWEKAIEAYNAGVHFWHGWGYAQKVLVVWRGLYQAQAGVEADAQPVILAPGAS